MTALLDQPADLTGLTDDELAALCGSGDDATIAAAMAEGDRRDRAERAAAGRIVAGRKYEALRLEWYENCAYPEFLQAQAYCGGGKMLSLLGERNTDEPSVLWTGSEDDAQAWASEELKGWWLDHPRTTFRTWLRQRARGLRAQREDAMESSSSKRSEAGPATGTTSPQRSKYTGRMPVMQAKRREAGGRMDTEQQAPAGDRFTDPEAWQAKSRARRAAIAKTAADAGIRPATGTVATRDRATITATAANVVPAAYAQPQAQVIDGAVLWHLLRRYLSHYVAFRTQADLEIVTGWLFHAIARERNESEPGPLIWRASPRLIVTSKTRGSGKSTLLDLIVILTQSRRGKIPKITPARIAQVIGKYYETVALDEARTIFGKGSKSLELQGCLLAGYTRRTSYEISGKSYSLFGAAAIAGKDEFINDADGTQIEDLVSRSFLIRLWPPTSPKPEVDETAEESGEELGGLIIEWTNAYREALKQAVRTLAHEDQEAAEAEIAAAEAAGRKPKPADPRRSQISRALRACALVAGPGIYAGMCAALDGSARSESAATLAKLEESALSWGDGFIDEDTSGCLVTEPGGDDDYDEGDELA